MSKLVWQDLYEIVITVTRITVPRSLHIYRVCDFTWRARLYRLSRQGLLQKLRFLINHLDLRTIVKCFKQGLFADDPDILFIGYDEIVRRGVRDMMYVKAVVQKYENWRGKWGRYLPSVTCREGVISTTTTLKKQLDDARGYFKIILFRTGFSNFFLVS